MIRYFPRYTFLCNLTAALFSLLVVAPLAYMVMDRDVPLKIEGGEVLPEQVVLGDTAQVHWQMQVLRICSGVVYRSLVDSQGTVWNSAPSKTKRSMKLGALDFTRNFQVPYGMALGPAKYQVKVLWRCNPLQQYWPIEMHTPVLTFKVLPTAYPFN